MSERVRKAWARIEGWLRAEAPSLGDQLRAGASEPEIRALEVRIGQDLPDELRAFYAEHDGGGFFLAFVAPELLTLRRAAEQWTMMKDLGFGRGELPNEGEPIGAVRPLWWSEGWLPVFGTSDPICVDLDPPPGGVRGQLVQVLHDDARRRVLFPSIAEWLEHWAEALEGGRYRYDEDADELVEADAGATPAPGLDRPEPEGERLIRALIAAGAIEVEEANIAALGLRIDRVLRAPRKIDALLMDDEAVDDVFWSSSQLGLFLEAW